MSMKMSRGWRRAWPIAPTPSSCRTWGAPASRPARPWRGWRPRTWRRCSRAGTRPTSSIPKRGPPPPDRGRFPLENAGRFADVVLRRIQRDDRTDWCRDELGRRRMGVLKFQLTSPDLASRLAELRKAYVTGLDRTPSRLGIEFRQGGLMLCHRDNNESGRLYVPWPVE